MFEAIVAACGVPDAKVELCEVTSPGGTYRVRWRE
jgi:hypothetical protein